MKERTIVKLIAIYRWIEQYQREHHSSPSIREWAAAVGINSTSVAHYYLRYMIQMGMIAPAFKHRPRSIVLLPLEQANERLRPFVEKKGEKK